MKPTNPPYISITDFTDQSQVHRMRDVLDEIGSKRLLGVGVMMSYKTLNGLETKWANWFPPKEEVAKIFVRREGVLNVLHYADFAGESDLVDLGEAVFWAGANLDAVQFDMIWPDIGMLNRLKSSFERSLKFIIQVNEKALERCANDPKEVARVLESYARAGCLDYALFDLSAGQGKAMNAELLLEYVEAALKLLPQLSVAVAGGLGPSRLGPLGPIIRGGNRLDLSICAQSWLRPSGKADQEYVDWDMAEAYVREAEALFREAEA